MENEDNKIKEIKCLFCNKTVKVELKPFGFGKIGFCPKCGQIIYNEKDSKSPETS
jgi:hypothetical protein